MKYAEFQRMHLENIIILLEYTLPLLFIAQDDVLV
jgi:hypothetical protein